MNIEGNYIVTKIYYNVAFRKEVFIFLPLDKVRKVMNDLSIGSISFRSC